VVGTAPIYDARIEVYRLNLVGANLEPPQFMAYSDANGRFYVQTDQFPGLPPDDPRKRFPILVTASGGQTYAPGSDEVIVLDPNTVHTLTVVADMAPGQRRDIVLSPLTTLTEALGRQRFELGLEADYGLSIIQAYALMNVHFDADLLRTVPAPTDVRINSVTEDVRYMLAVVGLWAMEQSIATRSGQVLPPFTLLDALIKDAHGPEAIFDGRGQDGTVTVGNCTPACELGPQTLRFDLTQALMVDFIPSQANGTGLDFPEVATYLYWLAGNMEPGLFGDNPALGFDDVEQPVAAALASPFFDESENRVRFDARLQAVHEHTPAALVDLSTTLGGPCDQVLHKHVDTLRADADDNPLRWRLAVRDDLTGVGAADIRAVLRPGGTGPGYELAVSPVAALGDIGPAFDIVAPGHIPELAQVEGRFELEIQAGDRQGNLALPVIGCWQHVPLAAPVHVAPLALALGPGSLAAANLDNDDVATLLGASVTPALGAPLVRIPVTNGSGEIVYLTPRVDEIAGTYDRTWIAARALVREDDDVDACMAGDPPACSTALPRAPRLVDRVSAQPLPGLSSPDAFVAVRVVDAQTGLAVACEECRPGEARLDPGRSYEVQVVATTLDFLVPAAVDPGRVTGILVGPSHDRQRLVGIVDEVEHVRCVDPEATLGICRGHQVFDLYQALTEARIDIRTVRVSARTAPSASLPPRTLRPAASGSDSTFSTPLSTAYEWSATEPGLPAEGDL
jgi:hypothetical protein